MLKKYIKKYALLESKSNYFIAIIKKIMIMFILKNIKHVLLL